MITFKIISDWYHYAILELTELKEFESDINWISQRLGISKIEAHMGIKRLKNIGLMVEDEDGNLKTSDEFTASPNEVQ